MVMLKVFFFFYLLSLSLFSALSTMLVFNIYNLILATILWEYVTNELHFVVLI